jgi:hypothetical protein
MLCAKARLPLLSRTGVEKMRTALPPTSQMTETLSNLSGVSPRGVHFREILAHRAYACLVVTIRLTSLIANPNAVESLSEGSVSSASACARNGAI